jgi:hypothetical protein
MINLRYHIVSLTAVFLAIGIGVTLGSTFLDRATVDNLNGQLENLATRLEERDARIGELESAQGTDRAIQTALDEQALPLLSGRLDGVPVAVMASRGVDEADVRGSLQALDAAEADVQGIFWFTDRFELDDAAAIDDLATVLGEESNDPSRLRRMVIDVLGDELQERQLADAGTEEDATEDDPPAGGPAGDAGAPTDTTVVAEPTTPTEPTGTTDGADGTGSDDEELSAVEDLLAALVENGFIDFEPVPGTPETPRFPDGTRILLVGGSSAVPDDLVVEPLLADMASGTSPLRVVAGSARADEGEISDLVVVIREDERLRELVSTVDRLEHFEGWAAMILALADTDAGVVGHYGVADGAARLLPQLPTP